MNYKRKRYIKQYRETHRKQLRKYRRLYELKNKVRIAKYRKQYKLEYRKNHPIKDARSARNTALKRVFGISLIEYNKLLKKQNDKCSICNMTPEQNHKAFAVDHCHNSKKIRGLLCSKCNIGLGYFDDNPERLKSAIKYLSILH